MNDHRIIELLRSGKRTKAFTKLYKSYPTIEQLICSKGGNKEDAKDIFQEALYIFYTKATRPDFVLSSAISTYLYSVCRFLWKDEWQKRNRQVVKNYPIEINAVEQEEIHAILQKEERYRVIEKVLNVIGERCKSLLRFFYVQQYSMKEIAKQMNFSSENVAKTQKYKCLEKAKIQLKEIL